MWYAGPVFDSSLSYVLIAAVGPAVTALAEQPEHLFAGTASSVLGAVGLVVWRLVGVLAKSLEHAEKHRELEVAQWRAADTHRAAECAHWSRGA